MPKHSAPPRRPVQRGTSTSHSTSHPSNNSRGPPVTAPAHAWFTSPARSHASYGQSKELPLHLIQLILEHLDDVADLARVTRTSRLFYYMTLPRLYEEVTLRSYADIRYVDGRPEGYGNGSPFAMGLNTLVSRTVADYVQSFRVTGEWREHDVEDYSKGRVPDNNMILQVAIRAALDRMKNLKAFAWQLNTKPMQSVYEGLMHKPLLTSLTLRCPTRRIPRPAAAIPPLPNLITFVIYDIDPLCYPDNISLLMLTAKRLENLKMHWSPRMRESGEESVSLLRYFGRAMAAKHQIPIKRMALYNLYTRNEDDGFEDVNDHAKLEEITVMNSMGNSDPINVFLDNTWKMKAHHQVPTNLKMMRTDVQDMEHVGMLARIRGMDRLYLINRPKSSKSTSTAATPITPAATSGNTPAANHTTGATPAQNSPASEEQCKGLASNYLAVIQSNHPTMRHLLLSPRWRLSADAIKKLCQSCPNLEQLGLASDLPPLEALHDAFVLCPNLWAVRTLIPPNSDAADKYYTVDIDMHIFVLATELWRPGYRSLKYFGIGDHVFKLGGVVYPPKGQASVPEGQENSMNARRAGPMRRIEAVERSSVEWIDIWRMDSVEFDVRFPD